MFPDRDKHRTFLRELNLLVINARTIARELSWQPKELVQYISSCIKKRMNPEDFQFNFSFSAHFKYVDSRNYFKEIDYLLSLKVAETLSGVKGVRAFRENSASKLYALGLYSFERSKNKECC